MTNIEFVDSEVCKHCGQELKKASKERKEILNTQLENIDKVESALTERQDKLDAASDEMLLIVQRIEAKVSADASTLEDVRALQERIRLTLAQKDALEKTQKERLEKTVNTVEVM